MIQLWRCNFTNIWVMNPSKISECKMVKEGDVKRCHIVSMFFLLDIARKVCWMCHVSCLWFNDIRVLIFSHRNNYIFGAKHYLRKVRLVSAKLWVYWAESYCCLTWPGHAEITVSLLVPKVNKSFNNLLHTTSGNNTVYILNFIINFVKQSGVKPNTTVFGI